MESPVARVVQDDEPRIRSEVAQGGKMNRPSHRLFVAHFDRGVNPECASPIASASLALRAREGEALVADASTV